MPERIRWSCPVCSRSYRIPEGNHPDACPTCSVLPAVDIDYRPPSRRNSRRAPWWVWPAIAGFGACAVLLFIFAWHSKIPDLHLLPRETDSEVRSAVRGWLRENLHDPQWEEVRWWPVAIVGNTPHIRFKFRSKNAFGALQLYDSLYRIDEGSVRDITDSPHSFWIWGQFPNDDVRAERIEAQKAIKQGIQDLVDGKGLDGGERPPLPPVRQGNQ